MVNQHYQRIATLKGTDGWIPTLHEMVIRGDNAWVTSNRNVPADLAKYGGVNGGSLVESAVQEYNLSTGKLLFTWNASDHIRLSDSYTQPPPNGFPWDAYHVNSVSINNNGTFIVSMRSTWAAYLVNIKTGKIIWTLGGEALELRAARQRQVPVAATTSSLHGNSDVTLFDDHCCEITGAGQFLSATGPSRGLELRLNTAQHTATVVAQYSHGTTFHSRYMGNTQILPNGRVFVGWGEGPIPVGVLRSAGKLLFDAAFPTPDISYRALRTAGGGRAAALSAQRRRSHAGLADNRLRELEWRPPGSPAGRSWPPTAAAR